MRALALLLLALAGGTGPAWAADPPRDAALAQALVGLWCNSQDGGRTCWAWDRFDADGGFEACGQADGDPRPFHGAGRIHVSGQRMCYRLSAASANFWLPAGASYCTEIVAIDAHTHRYRDLDTGAEFTLYRRPAGEPPCAP